MLSSLQGPVLSEQQGIASWPVYNTSSIASEHRKWQIGYAVQSWCHDVYLLALRLADRAIL
eukprot:1152627-Pelagomonas_calceolata.AAC.1